MTTQHTPSPWIWGPNARLYADASLPECQRVQNVQLGKTTALCWDENDAQLIAAAPDLLAALEACLYRLDAHDNQSAPECLAARAAIAKATGVQP